MFDHVFIFKKISRFLCHFLFIKTLFRLFFPQDFAWFGYRVNFQVSKMYKNDPKKEVLQFSTRIKCCSIFTN